MRLLFTALLALNSLMALAQSDRIRFIDPETLEPISGVVVTLKGGSYISDSEGYVNIKAKSLPTKIQIKHVSYESGYFEYPGGDISFDLKPTITTMDEVVVSTDPYQDVAINRDLFEVREVDRKTIDQLGGNNLSDVLNYSMNMTIVPDVATGRSTVNMFGLSGEYVKILVDNVPLAGDNGSGNNIDISQINLENVERVEISEGAMGVQYGSNAVAGVINIITKKNMDKKLEVQVSIQEETVGPEYAWFDKGRHIQNLQASGKINEKLFVSGKVSRNIFTGFFNDFRGKDYIGTDGLRGHEWNPKEQLSTTGIVNYALSPSVSAFYKFDHYNETLDIYDRVVINRLGFGGEPDHTATDEQFISNRYSHQFNLSGNLGKLPFTAITSWQTQKREYEDYTYNLDYQAKVSSRGRVTNQSSDILYARGSLNDLFQGSELVSLNLGYEAEHQKGYDAIASGAYSDNISEQTLWYTDLFATVPLSLSNNFKVIPGLRFNNNSLYDGRLIWSSTLDYRLPKDMSMKFIVGSAYKTPNFSQLYFYFVDANHNVTGNIDLDPEDGVSLMLDIDKQSHAGEWQIKNSIKAYHFNIDGKITLLQVLDESSTGQSISRFTYLNADNYRNYGFTIENNIRYRALDLALGMNYITTEQYLDEAEANAKASTFSATSNMAYTLNNLGLRLGVNIKYNGPGQQFYLTGDTIEPGQLRGFALVDSSVKKSFLNEALNLSIGGRNLLNVISVNASGLSAGRGHDGTAPAATFFSTGRSWFMKLSYKIGL